MSKRVAMNPIQNVGGNLSISKLQSTSSSAKSEPTASAEPFLRGRDSVELSGVQNYLQTLKTNDIRVDKVSEIKAQIAAGTYETDEKLDLAAGKLLDDLG